jgi:hypothetical protein
MKTFKQFSTSPVSLLKDVMIANRSRIIKASKKDAYDIIDKIMTDIAKTYDISGEELHDMWVKKYDITPDEWVKKQ